MNDRYIYVFVRQDLSLADQMVHSNHAVFHMAALIRPEEGIPSLVVIGVPHENSMKKVIAKLKELQLAHYEWIDPDFNESVTAIATIPLTVNQKDFLRNYRLWRHSPGAATAACLLAQDGGAKGRHSSEKEHSVSNGGVTGSIPVGGSSFVTHP